ncbi:DUF2271 domain-containing protein [bacterium]|nr:DUF2271 domain-containing protein [bacterium]
MRYLTLLTFCLALLATVSLRAQTSDSLKLEISFNQDPAVYEESDYGEAPQVAVWLVDSLSGQVRTVYVTYRTASGDFYGKTECPVSLPVWIAAWRHETGRTDFPTLRDKAAEAVTRATSQDGKVHAETKVAAGQRYLCYIEMNVAGDFNSAYPFERQDGTLDNHGNGQPSLVYRAALTAADGATAVPEPVGRTEQYGYTGEIIHDLQGLDSALKCLTSLAVTCSAN